MRFSVRPAIALDVPKVTRLIHDAFSIWKEQGLDLAPMHQTDAQTAVHLIGQGYVAVNSEGELAGTFSLDEGAVRRIRKAKIRFMEDGATIDYSRISDAMAPLPSGRLLVFKKAAVRRDAANSGLGSELYALAEKTGRENGYSGMVLETAKAAGWLYDWYVRLGFKPIGSYRYPGSQVDTILMIKPFGRPAAQKA
jgi:predicted N-acetyltransferase YhbS